MGKFYIAPILLFVTGLVLYRSASTMESTRENGIYYFAAMTIGLTGVATFILAFGYHVRSAARKLDGKDYSQYALSS